MKHPLLRHFVAPYTILFAITASIVFLPFIAAGKSLVWDSDAVYQHLNAFIYFGRWLREIAANLINGNGFVVPLWDFSIGYGSDILTTMHYYAFGDPLNLISALVPSRYAEYAYGALILVRIYLSGLFFMLYARKMGCSHRSALAGALVYAFCGWTLFSSVRHPYFMNPMIYLPLLLLGFEKIYRQENPALFMISVFISAISNFYFFYMLLIAIVGYAVFRFFSSPNRTSRAFLKLFARSLGYGCIGVLMACVLFIPVITLFLSTERSGLRLMQDPLYGLSYYLQFPLAFLTPGIKQNWTCLGFAPPALLCLIALFCTKGHRELKIALVLLTVLLLLPQAGKAFNGFSYATNRWCWMYSFVVALTAATLWDRIPQLMQDRRASATVIAATTTFLVLALVLLFPLSFMAFPSSSIDLIRGMVLPSLVALALTVAIAFFAPRLEKRGSARHVGSLTSFLLIAIAVVGIGIAAQNAYSTLNTPDKYIDAGKSYAKIRHTPATDAAAIQKGEPDFSRFEAQDLGLMNPADIVNARGVDYYWSLGGAPISQYYTKLGLATRRTAYSYYSLEQRAPLYALASVKYFIGPSGTEPYGFTPVEQYELKHSGKKDVLFQNENALPLGYTYGTFIPLSSFNDLPLEQRQEAMLNGAVIPDESSEMLPSSIKRAFWTPTAQTIETDASCDGRPLNSATGISLPADSSKRKLSLSFEGLPDSETYIVLTGLYANRSVGLEGHWSLKEQMQIKVSSGERKTNLRLSTDYYRWTTGQHDFLISLGYSKEGLTEATLSLPANAAYSIESLKVVCQPMKGFAAQVDTLKENTLNKVEITPNTVTGTISLQQDKILCLSIPYDKGWHAEVDGQPAELIRSNIMFMALPLTQGEHSIALYYETVGLRWGMAASALGVVLFGAVLVLRRTSISRTAAIGRHRKASA